MFSERGESAVGGREKRANCRNPTKSSTYILEVHVTVGCSGEGFVTYCHAAMDPFLRLPCPPARHRRAGRELTLSNKAANALP